MTNTLDRPIWKRVEISADRHRTLTIRFKRIQLGYAEAIEILSAVRRANLRVFKRVQFQFDSVRRFCGPIAGLVALLTRVGFDASVAIQMSGLHGPAEREAYAYVRSSKLRSLPRMPWDSSSRLATPGGRLV